MLSKFAVDRLAYLITDRISAYGEVAVQLHIWQRHFELIARCPSAGVPQDDDFRPNSRQHPYNTDSPMKALEVPWFSRKWRSISLS